MTDERQYKNDSQHSAEKSKPSGKKEQALQVEITKSSRPEEDGQ